MRKATVGTLKIGQTGSGEKTYAGATLPECVFRDAGSLRHAENGMPMRVRSDAARRVSSHLGPVLMSVLLATAALAQSSKLSNVDLCDGKDRSSSQPQIIGCTALIKSDTNSAQVRASAHNNRGNAFSAIGQYELAIQDYGESINLNSNFAKPYNNRGVAFKKKGDYDRAIKDFDAAIKIDPNYINAFVNRGEVYQLKGDYSQALKDFDEAIRLKPEEGALWNERCWTHALAGDLPAGLDDCNESLRLQPKAAATFDSRGFIYLKLGQWDLALSDYNSALRLNPKFPQALYGRGLARRKMGDLARAKTDVAAAKAADKNIATEFARYGLQ